MISTETLYWILFGVPAIIIASTIHEYAHGWVAYKLGDPTAKAYGRLTLNPLSHIDPVGAISMILFKFGWSKPVPINESNFERRELGTALTALAGPLSNAILVLILGAINLIFRPNLDSILGSLLFVFITVNISLAVFNLLPIPPLDGHKIVRALLPKKIRYYWEKMEKYSIIFILLIVLPFSPVGRFVGGLIISVLTAILRLFKFL
ncbi:MAG: site-2 protease family protein [Candidatus Dojkabacteria bacterium]|nr:site-2 protease family protein [Candidatus Dojkabacteria bacterium]